MIYIKNMVIFETGNHHNQYLRPYRMDVDYSVLGEINNQLHNGDDLTPQGLATISNQFINPSATIDNDSQIVLPGGWSEPRFRFMIQVVISNELVDNMEVICGWTDYPGATPTGALDPNMKFYINSTTLMKKTRVYGAAGMQEYYIVDRPKHLSSADASGVHGVGETGLYQLSPQTVLSSISTLEFIGGLEDCVDTSSFITSRGNFSDRDNTNPGRYAGHILNKYKDTIISDSMTAGVDMDKRNRVSRTRSAVMNAPLRQDSFMSALFGVNGDAQISWFTPSELTQIDPSFHDRLDIIFKDRSSFSNYVSIGGNQIDMADTQHLAGSDHETVSAIKIANILPTIMMDYGLTSISFSSTNDVLGGRPETFITAVHSFKDSNIDITPLYSAIIDRIESELVAVVSLHNQIVYDIIVTCDITGNTAMSLRFALGVPTPFVIPTFADSLLSPLVTNNKSDVRSLANGFNGLFTLIEDAVEPHLSQMEVNHAMYNPDPGENFMLKDDDFLGNWSSSDNGL